MHTPFLLLFSTGKKNPWFLSYRTVPSHGWLIMEDLFETKRLSRIHMLTVIWPSAERDSLKDEAVVFIFIFATAGLLLWALLKPYVQKWVVVCLPSSLPSTNPHHPHGNCSAPRVSSPPPSTPLTDLNLIDCARKKDIRSAV
jgi:hypothetical protein